MSFFSHHGLFLLCVTLLSLPVDGTQCSTNVLLFPGFVMPNCCTDSSKALIKEPVKACFEQKPETFRNCKIHAYFLITASDHCYCVDPSAKWLPRKIQQLKEEGISCKMLGES